MRSWTGCLVLSTHTLMSGHLKGEGMTVSLASPSHHCSGSPAAGWSEATPVLFAPPTERRRQRSQAWMEPVSGQVAALSLGPNPQPRRP